MKIKKLSKNSLEIILTVEELSQKDISLTDIECGKNKAKDFFFEIIKSSSYSKEFLIENSKLLVEASVSNKGLLIVTITNMGVLDYSKASSLIASTQNMVYSFNSIDNLKAFTNVVYNHNLFCGINYLYELNDMYIIIFSKSNSKCNEFHKTARTILEYCDNTFSSKDTLMHIKEKGTSLINYNALQVLANYLFE